MAKTKLVIRGLILPGGMPHIAKLEEAEYTTWFLAGFKVNKIRKQFEKGKIGPQVSIVGHSLGANAAINAANELAEAGMQVEVLALDPTYTNSVAGKVNRAIAVQSNDFRAREILGAKNISRSDLNHMNMTRDKELVKLAIDILD